MDFTVIVELPGVPALTVTPVAVIVNPALATVTAAVPVAPLYVEDDAASGEYVAVSVSLPTAREPAGTVIVAAPLASAVAADV